MYTYINKHTHDTAVKKKKKEDKWRGVNKQGAIYQMLS